MIHVAGTVSSFRGSVAGGDEQFLESGGPRDSEPAVSAGGSRALSDVVLPAQATSAGAARTRRRRLRKEKKKKKRKKKRQKRLREQEGKRFFPYARYERSTTRAPFLEHRFSLTLGIRGRFLHPSQEFSRSPLRPLRLRFFVPKGATHQSDRSKHDQIERVENNLLEDRMTSNQRTRQTSFPNFKQRRSFLFDRLSLQNDL